MKDYAALIEAETKLIAELESSYPKEFKSLEWYQHHTKCRDAYWRRRMLIAERDGLDKHETAKVY